MTHREHKRLPWAVSAAVAILAISGLLAPVCLANTANISCGAPKRSGNVTVKIKVTRANGTKDTVEWTTSIEDADSASVKAAKIRSAAPTNNPDVTIGGTMNTVSAASKGGSTIDSMGLRPDKTNERSASNVFAVDIANHIGGVGFEGAASGEGFGSPGSVTIGAGGREFIVETTPGMTVSQVHGALLDVMQASGVGCRFAEAADGLDEDDFNEASPPIMILEIDVNGLLVDVNDTGLWLELMTLIDTTPLPDPFGGCCYDGNCIDTTAGMCADIGGTFRGAGSECGLVACPINYCLPDFNGNDVVEIEDLLELIAAWGPCNL
ncbi:MAG: hypothetical protein GY894_02210 [Planctomycetes bacterium]|jgi:hypothetical protein|nr:hypothetical protein [Planctomycetota bacterium]MCP4838164.1 hypothetical protein [Planctomycetota bacterium]